MFRKMTITVCLVAACVWCLTLVAQADHVQASAGKAAFKPVAAVRSLMAGQKIHYSAIGALLDEPDARKRARRLAVSAELLAELANVNIEHATKDDYRGWATDLRDSALKLAREAEKQNDDGEAQMQGLYRSINKICMKCHDVYQE